TALVVDVLSWSLIFVLALQYFQQQWSFLFPVSQLLLGQPLFPFYLFLQFLPQQSFFLLMLHFPSVLPALQPEVGYEPDLFLRSSNPLPHYPTLCMRQLVQWASSPHSGYLFLSQEPPMAGILIDPEQP